MHFSLRPREQKFCDMFMGVGSAKRLFAVRWRVAREIVADWVLTFPACAPIALVVYLLVDIAVRV